MKTPLSSSNSNIRHFIFGYGSLICAKSRSITAPTLHNKPAQPVAVQHLQRSWTARVPHCEQTNRRLRQSLSHGSSDNEKSNGDGSAYDVNSNDILEFIQGQTCMGIERSEGSMCFGVLIEVNEEELSWFDAREKGYTREEIDLTSVWGIHFGASETDNTKNSNQHPQQQEKDLEHVVLRLASKQRQMRQQREKQQQQQDSKVICIPTSSEEEHAKCWVYIPQIAQPATPTFPIVQSYVDIILRGCLDVAGPEFALKVLETTSGWHPLDTTPNTTSYAENEVSHDANNTMNSNSRTPTPNPPHNYIWLEERSTPFYIRADLEFSRSHSSMLDELHHIQHTSAMQHRCTVPYLDELLRSSHNNTNIITSTFNSNSI